MSQGRSRREEYSDATRRALLDSATRLFAERGYARASLDDIAADARVTKGALYHHFDGKQALFEAVVDQAEQRTHARIVATYTAEKDPWRGALAATRRFLEECCDATYGRLVFLEAPVALGWPRWRDFEAKYGYGLTEALLRSLIDSGDLPPSPVPATTTVAFGMLCQSGLALAEAPDVEKPRLCAEFARIIEQLLMGLRTVAPTGGAGRQPPEPENELRSTEPESGGGT